MYDGWWLIINKKSQTTYAKNLFYIKKVGSHSYAVVWRFHQHISMDPIKEHTDGDKIEIFLKLTWLDFS